MRIANEIDPEVWLGDQKKTAQSGAAVSRMFSWIQLDAV
jgi:hypothetical protein